MNRIKLLIASLLPGLFLVGFNIGTGSVTAMAKSGAQYNMSLTWAVAFSCFITFFLINLFGKFTLVTGETALSAFRKHLHPGVGLFFVVGLTVNVSGSVMGVMGIISDVCYEMSKTWVDGGIAPVYFAVFFIGLVYVLFLAGKTKSFERALAIMVAIMAVCFIANFFMLMPPFQSLLSGMVPRMPEPIPGTGDKPYLVVASMVGTTVFSGLFIVRTILVREAGWQLKDLIVQRRDAIVSAVLMFVISVCIMGSAAGALYNRGVTLDHAAQMLTLLQPLAGSFASVIFAIGLIAAGVSSQFPNVILLPMLLSDYRNTKLDMKKVSVKWIVLVMSLLGLVVPVFNAAPVSVMIASQAFGAVLLPFTVISMMILGNNRKLMKSHAFSVGVNAMMIVILLFAGFMAYNGIAGITELLAKG